VEARQRVELTSTNRPFGLIIKLTQTVDHFVIAHGKFASNSDHELPCIASAVRSA
jgi:hypothetical protein